MAIRVEIADEFGNVLLNLRQFARVEWTSVYNDVGWFEIEFAANDYPRDLFVTDRRVNIFRRAPGRAERLAFAGYMRKYSERSPQYVYSEDYGDELTVAYYGGSGQEAARLFAVGATNDTRLRASAINRREGFYQDTNEDDTDILEDACAGMLYDKRPVLDYEPANLELEYIYQADWNLGDTLRVNFGDPESVTIAGPCFNDLLARRIIAYPAASSEAQKTDYADDMMKAFVDENLVNATDGDRNLVAGVGFGIAGDQSAGPEIDYSARYDNLLAVLKRISDTSAETGDRVLFSIVPQLDGAGRYVPRFVTAVGQFGRVLDLKIGRGKRQITQAVVGVRGIVTADEEQITPLLEEIDD